MGLNSILNFFKLDEDFEDDYDNGYDDSYEEEKEAPESSFHEPQYNECKYY